jgi:outer membrane protein OmpA-like peptidoglycan-associated protein
MRILLIGLVAFSIWSVLATNIYVCKILELCDDPETSQNIEADLLEAIVVDRLKDGFPVDSTDFALVQKQAVAPEDLIVRFAFDKSDIGSVSLSGKYVYESIIYLDQNSQASISITGHTDAVGANSYNMALGVRRAETMQHYFESNGIPPGKIILQSQGEEKPADDNNTAAGRANNRRTVITIKK